MSERLFVISAPSGAGKTSLVKALLQRLPDLRASTSHTTRAPRPDEQDGREYHFVTPAMFQRMVEQQAFLEHAQVFDNHYGTGVDQLRQKLTDGHDVILEIDWQGARQVRAALPGCCTIFILPPSLAALKARLDGRATDSPAVIARRLADAVSDMSHWREFDYVVVNDDFGSAVEALAGIIAGQGAPYRADRPQLTPLLANLLEFPTP